MRKILRAEAKALGYTRYFTGNSCKHGHTAERYTSNGSCIECIPGPEPKCKLRKSDDPEWKAKDRARRNSYQNEMRRKIAREKNPSYDEERRLSKIDSESRNAAKLAGISVYVSVVPCIRGHVGIRQAANSSCIECVRIEKRRRYSENKEYFRSLQKYWRLKNPDKYRDIAKRSRERNRSARLRGKVAYYNRVKFYPDWQKKQRSLRVARREEKKEYDRKYREKHREKLVNRAKLWAKRNPEKRKAIVFSYSARRRAIENRGDPASVVLAWIQSQEKVCFWCSVSCASGYHIDHFYPLSKGGEHRVTNLRISCPSCNLRKNARDPYEFAAEVGKFL
jgi:5-methylcytosine-specific restriction endonuclease McrA